MDDKVMEEMIQEYKRANLALVILAELRQERCGYTLRKALGEHGLPVEAGSLYPLLYRLETKGLLESEWRDEGNRKKHFYRLSEDGRSFLRNFIKRVWAERPYFESLMEEFL